MLGGTKGNRKDELKVIWDKLFGCLGLSRGRFVTDFQRTNPERQERSIYAPNNELDDPKM